MRNGPLESSVAAERRGDVGSELADSEQTGILVPYSGATNLGALFHAGRPSPEGSESRDRLSEACSVGLLLVAVDSVADGDPSIPPRQPRRRPVLILRHREEP